MTYRLEIRPDALADIDQAAQWYDNREAGLGDDFARGVLEAIDGLRLSPLIYRIRHRRRNVRWRLMDRFPYRIVYQIAGDKITVLAVVHSARHNRHWKNRLSK